MGKIRGHSQVKLIVGMITCDTGLLSSAETLLSQKFGDLDFCGAILPFNYTDYYVKEMGDDLKRKFISFETLIQPEVLVEIKHWTNNLEGRFLSDAGKRRINLDPGYVSAAKLILASTKDHIHRIYLRDGIYAEITLYVENKSFRPWQWTYPDYRSEEYISIFNKIRQTYMEQLKEEA